MDAKYVLLENPYAGDKIPRRLTPRFYKRKFNTVYVFRYPVPEAHRIIYYVRTHRGQVQVIIIELLTHKEYDKRFGY